MLARAPLKNNSVNRTKVHSTTNATVMKMKASRLFTSFEARPQMPDEWQSDQDQREQTRLQSADRVAVLRVAPDEPFPPFTPRQWGINE
jgi:hypothetical protein